MKIIQWVTFAPIKTYPMKQYTLLLAMMALSMLTLQAQNGRVPAIDKSPLDMSYYPANYPILKIQEKLNEPLLARVVYSRPAKNNRVVFGELIEYGSIWRLGANEATELELFKDARIGNLKVKKGRYTLYAIPTEKNWTIIINRDTDTWGAFKYDQKKDVGRVTVPVEKTSEITEYYTMFFEKNGPTVNLQVYWDNYKAAIPIQF
jgi:hypothetical protein